LHGLDPRKPLEGALYGLGIGGRVLARRGKGGQRRAPPRPRPQTPTPPQGFTPPVAETTPANIVPKSATTSPVTPVQKQYGDIVADTPEEPEVVEVVEEIEVPAPEVVDENPVAAAEGTTIQDGADRKSLGLTSLETTVVETVVEVESDEDRTSNLLKDAQAFAKSKGYGAQIATSVPAPEPVEEKKERTPRRISKAKKNNQRVEQRATRARRLNRSRHVEYRYEMRALLKEIEVSPEQHSVLLGTIWAKGERQDVNAAKEFVRERVSSGAITEEQCERLLSIIDSYTTRR